MLCNRGYNNPNSTPEYVNIKKLLIFDCDSEETVLDLCSQSNKSLRNESSSNLSLTQLQRNVVLDRKNYLRQNLMIPLTWALSKTLKYKPTNPIHYIACQLLRWKNNIKFEEKDEITDYVVAATIKKDCNLLEQMLQKEENQTNKSKSKNY